MNANRSNGFHKGIGFLCALLLSLIFLPGCPSQFDQTTVDHLQKLRGLYEQDISATQLPASDPKHITPEDVDATKAVFDEAIKYELAKQDKEEQAPKP